MNKESKFELVGMKIKSGKTTKAIDKALDLAIEGIKPLLISSEISIFELHDKIATRMKTRNITDKNIQIEMLYSYGMTNSELQEKINRMVSVSKVNYVIYDTLGASINNKIDFDEQSKFLKDEIYNKLGLIGMQVYYQLPRMQ